MRRSFRVLFALAGAVGVLAILLVRSPGGVSIAASSPATPTYAATQRTAAASWRTSGPYADDATAIAGSPNFSADRTVFLGVSYTLNPSSFSQQSIAAILKSTDAGDTWSEVWRNTVSGNASQNWLVQIVVSPAFANDGTVFALYTGSNGAGMIKSTDHGASFNSISFAPFGGLGIWSNSKTLSVSPKYGVDRTVAVTANSGTSATSYLSTDAGATWRIVAPSATDSCSNTVSGGGFLLVLTTGTVGSFVPNANAVCSNNTDQMFAVSTDGGKTWTKEGDLQAAVGNSNFDTQHSRMTVAPDGSSILYTDQYGNVARSTDGGASWASVLGNGLGNDAPPLAAGSPYYLFQYLSPTNVYAIHEWFGATPRYFHSSDGGANWSVGWQANGATNIHDVFAADPQTIYFAGGNFGLIRTTDGGKVWRSIGTFRPQHNTVALSPNYAVDHTVFTVDFPGGTNTVGQDTAGYGIYRSTDSGATWSEPEAPNPANLDQYGFGTVFTTAKNGGLSLRVSPNFATDRTIAEGDRIGTVALSRDGGLNWKMSLISNQVGWYVYSLAFSPNYATDGALYAGLGNLGFGVAKTTDGQRWSTLVPPDRFQEITQDQVRALDASAEPNGLVDLGLGMGQLYLTRDTPASTNPPEWLATGSGAAYAVAMSPNYQRDCTIYIAQWPGPTGIGATLEDGVYVSRNACSTVPPSQYRWTWLTSALPVRDFDTVVLSPNFPSDQTLFIGSYSAGVWVSRDAGSTWEPYNDGLDYLGQGLSPSLVVHQLAIAATGGQSGVLYAATDSGIWQTPVSLAPRSNSLVPRPRVYIPLVPVQARQ